MEAEEAAPPVGLAQPVADAGGHGEVLQLGVVPKLERVVLQGQVRRPAGGEGNGTLEVEVTGGKTDKVSAQRIKLCGDVGRVKQAAQQKGKKQ